MWQKWPHRSLTDKFIACYNDSMKHTLKVTSRTKEIRKCLFCEKEFHPHRGKKRNHRFCSKSCGIKNRHGKNKEYRNEKILRKLYLEEKMSFKQIARKLQCGATTIQSYLRFYKIPVREPYNPYVIPKMLLAERNPNWKGGRFIASTGYVYILSPNHPTKSAKRGKKYVAEHNLVMEKNLERFLEKNERVHHLDGNKQNNQLSNLMLFPTNGKHIEFEQKVSSFAKKLIWGIIKPELKNSLQKLFQEFLNEK